jgi:hypothetical protein
MSSGYLAEVGRSLPVTNLENTRKNKPGTSINISENTAFVLVDKVSAAALQQRIAGHSLRGFWCTSPNVLAQGNASCETKMKMKFGKIWVRRNNRLCCHRYFQIGGRIILLWAIA